LLHTLSDHSAPVWSVSFSPDGDTLASASNDKTVKLWDVKDRKLLHTLSGHSDWVFSVSFSPGGNTLASASADKTVKLWELKSGKVLYVLNSNSGKVISVAFSPNVKRIADENDGGYVELGLAAGNDGGTVKLWKVYVYSENMGISLLSNISFLPDNEWIAYHPEKLVYNSSLQGDEYASIRFDNQLRPVYPLEYYRNKLKREEDLSSAFQTPQPEIKPKRIRLWWDRTENKKLWFGGFIFVTFIGLAVTITLRRRVDPMVVAKQFFARAGFEKVRVAGNFLLLHPKDGQMTGMAILWQEEQSEQIFVDTRSQKQWFEGELKFYILYKGQGPSSKTIHSLREELGCEVIPLLSSILERALSKEDNCKRVLKELEEPYLTRIDPYAESKPIHDPTWFYGRDEFLKRLPAVLAQGQHVGIFGLRKVGKTSLTNQLRQRFFGTPTVFMDCQAFSARAEIYFEEILKQLHAEFRSHGIKGLPRLQTIADREDFRRQFLAMFELWEKSGQRGHFLIILDEIDKLFPSQEMRDREDILAEYVRLFRVLRGLAQSRRCLVTLVTAYRPDVNRRDLLPPSVGENPMFRSYQEEYLGFLSPEDSEAMIREIGLWRQIVWDVDAAQRVFHYCGGHPLITRFFASHTCEGGALKTIDYEQVEATAGEIQRTLRRNDFGNFYKEGIWDRLHEDEQQVLGFICQAGEQGISEAEIPNELDEALRNLEHFGLVVDKDGKLHPSAQLFKIWLERRIGL